MLTLLLTRSYIVSFWTISKNSFADLAAGPRQTFAALESLQIFCNVFSDVVLNPFVLSLQEGIILNELSSLLLIRDSLNPATNPYLDERSTRM
jgi:hypothetical protein